MLCMIGSGKYHDSASYQFTSLVPPLSSKPLQSSSRHNASFHQTGMPAFTTIYTYLQLLMYIGMYEENMLARQSSQPTYNRHRKQVEFCVNNFSPFAGAKKPSGTTKDANHDIPSKAHASCYF